MLPTPPRSIYRRAVRGVRTAATYDDLPFLRIEDDHFVFVHTVCIWDETTDAVTGMFIITTIGTDYLACRIAQADKDTGKSQRADFWLRPGDILVARFWDGTNLDVLNAYVHGIEYTSAFGPATGL